MNLKKVFLSLFTGISIFVNAQTSLTAHAGYSFLTKGDFPAISHGLGLSTPINNVFDFGVDISSHQGYSTNSYAGSLNVETNMIITDYYSGFEFGNMPYNTHTLGFRQLGSSPLNSQMNTINASIKTNLSIAPKCSATLNAGLSLGHFKESGVHLHFTARDAQNAALDLPSEIQIYQTYHLQWLDFGTKLGVGLNRSLSSKTLIGLEFNAFYFPRTPNLIWYSNINISTNL